MLTGCQEPEPPVYEGKLLVREGLHYKPKSIEPFSGRNREWHENGQLRWEGNFKDGKQHGLERFFLPSGLSIKDTCWSNGEEVGMSICQPNTP